MGSKGAMVNQPQAAGQYRFRGRCYLPRAGSTFEEVVTVAMSAYNVPHVIRAGDDRQIPIAYYAGDWWEAAADA